MAKGTNYRVTFRRRREGRTDYRLRKKLIISGSLRIVVRKSIKHINLQLVDSKFEGDSVLAHAGTIELKKFGWKGGTGNLPAAYLAGFLMGKRAVAMGKTSAIADFNSYNITDSNRLYAALKGAIDAGLSIPHDKGVIPDEERVSGAHIASYADTMQKTDPAKYAAYFSQYIAAGIVPEKLVEHYEETKKRIEKEVK